MGWNHLPSDQSSHITLPDAMLPAALKASLAQACKSHSLKKPLQTKLKSKKKKLKKKKNTRLKIEQALEVYSELPEVPTA